MGNACGRDADASEHAVEKPNSDKGSSLGNFCGKATDAEDPNRIEVKKTLTQPINAEFFSNYAIIAKAQNNCSAEILESLKNYLESGCKDHNSW